MTQPSRVPVQALVQQMQMGTVPWWLPQVYKTLLALRQVDFDYFVLGTDFTPLQANATLANNITVPGDADFCILSAVIVETDVANTTFLAQQPILFQLTDTGSGRDLANTPIHADNWFGTAQEPKYWDVPKVLRRNSVFRVTAQNLEGVNRNVRVAFHGFKIFPYSQ